MRTALLDRPALRSLQMSSSAWGVASGYGRFAMSLTRALTDVGIKVAVLGRPALTGDGPPLPGVEADVDYGSTLLHIGEPLSWQIDPNKYNVAYCWWPYSAIPEGWSSALYGVRKLILPTRWVRDGITPPFDALRFCVVPIGLDASTFVPLRRKRGEQLRLMFYAVHADDYAAGADLAVSAFLRAFPIRTDVTLDIWSSAQCYVEAPDSRIQMRRHIGTDGDLVRLYHQYDALLAPARAVGAGFIVLEALASGMPVFHSGQGALEPLADVGILTGAQKIATLIQAHRSATCFEPLLDVFTERLKRFEADYEAAQNTAMEHAATVRSRFSWKRTANLLLRNLA